MNVYEVGIPYLIRALTPLHAGSGARISGIVDLPVQREAHTGLPVVYGSSIKGALRAWARVKLKVDDKDKNKISEIFGPEPESGGEGMGKAVFTDAKLLFFPVKSLRGIFAWITSPFLLNRFVRDITVMESMTGDKSAGREGCILSSLEKFKVVPSVDIEKALTPKLEGTASQGDGSNSKVVIKTDDSKRVVVLEDVGLEVEEGEGLTFLDCFRRGLSSRIGERLVIVNDEMFIHLLSRGMEIVPHIRIDPATNTVKKGGLWYQENLPPETFLYSFVFTQKNLKNDVVEMLKGYLQFGGDTTTGLGIAELLVAVGRESRAVREPNEEAREVPAGQSEGKNDAA